MEILCPLVQFRSGQICKGRRNTDDETQEITAGDEHFGDVWNSYNCLVDLGFLLKPEDGRCWKMRVQPIISEYDSLPFT